MRTSPIEFAFALGIVALGALSACDERPRASGNSSGSGSIGAPGARPSSAPPARQPEESKTPAPAPAAPAPDDPTPSPEYTITSTRWKLGEVHDLGPAGPTTASAEGVFFVTLDESLLLSRRKEDGFEALDESPERFARYGRGPALTSTHAYWIAPRGVLLRAARKTGSIDELAPARSGTRVSALQVGGRDVVAFIADVDEDPRAFVWAEGQTPLRLSEDASTATSVELIAAKPQPYALVLEGRTGMSPLHLREVRVTKKHLNLGPDEVVWVGPGSQPLTELESLDRPGGGAFGFLATSHDVTHFGLAHFSLTNQGELTAPPRWRPYPNGIDPAPVAAAHLCGKDYVAFALPTESRPRAPQELHLARLGPDGTLADEEVIARSRAFNDVSLAPSSRGAVLAWTADRRTWGLTLGCP